MKNLGKSVMDRNFPYPSLRGQPLKVQKSFCPVNRKAMDREKSLISFFLLFKGTEGDSMIGANMKEKNIYFWDFCLFIFYAVHT